MKLPELDKIGPTTGREWRALDRESDPELRLGGMLALGRRLLALGEIPAALRLFQIVQNEGAKPFPRLATQAQGEIEAIEGHGTFGQRVEFLGRQFFREASAPAGLAAMAGSQAVFGLARAALLSRLTSSPTARLWTRGFGARALASTGAFALEAPSFVAFSRGTAAALGEKQDGSRQALIDETAASFLTLGALKLGAWAGGGRPSLASISTLGGILLGHRLEEFAGLRAPTDGATALTDGLATLLHFKVAGRLLGSALGPRWTAYQQELHWRGEGRNGPLDDSPLGWRNVALASGIAAGNEGAKSSHLLMMQDYRDGSSPVLGEMLKQAPPAVQKRIERLKGEEKLSSIHLIRDLIEEMTHQGRAALSAREKEFLLAFAHRQLDEYEKPPNNYYQAYLIFTTLQDFPGLRRLADLIDYDSAHKRHALLMLEDYPRAFGTPQADVHFYREGRLHEPISERIEAFAAQRGYPEPSIFAVERTASDLKQLSASYDLILAIAGGGLSSGGVAEFLDLPVKVIDVHAHNREKPISKFVDEIRPEDIAGKRVLFVDKDMVTGASIREALRLIEPYKPGAVGAYFNHELSKSADRAAARDLRDQGFALHFPYEAEPYPSLALFYHAHEKLETPLGRFRQAARKLEALTGRDWVGNYLSRLERAFFAFNPELAGVEGVREMMANRLESLTKSYSDALKVNEEQAKQYLSRVLRYDSLLPPAYGEELANARYHPRAVAAAESRGVINVHQPHSYPAAFRSAQQAAKGIYEVALIVGPEGFAYEPIFRDLGLKTVAVNIPEADFNGKRSIALLDNLEALHRKGVLVVEDDVQSGATLRKLLAEIQPYQPGLVDLYLGLPTSRQMTQNIPPEFKRVYFTEEYQTGDDVVFLNHLKKRETIFKDKLPRGKR